MRAQTFLAKLSLESLRTMDEQINNWLDRTKARPKLVNQVFGYERHHHSEGEEPVMIVTVWYDAAGPRPGPGEEPE
ncbi:MAG: hypothetical protein NTZ09_12215 [Candidatus Hydrogenedentes bacterium]|nr:hypothetical protein [Candidatus Hydrogenedentota bacterium]